MVSLQRPEESVESLELELGKPKPVLWESWVLITAESFLQLIGNFFLWQNPKKLFIIRHEKTQELGQGNLKVGISLRIGIEKRSPTK